MKKIVLFICLIWVLSVQAESKIIQESNVFNCNGKYYGSHGNPLHFHEVKKSNDAWVIVSGEVEAPSCYLKPVNVKEKVVLSKCIDGDTARFIINKQNEIVRFLAINAPEIAHENVLEEPFGEEASKYTCKELTKAKEIVLEYDSNSDKKDKYGRILAYVFVDNKLLEKKLIQKGFAKVAFVYGDYSYIDELKKEEEKAKAKKVGIWSIESTISEYSNNEEENIINKVISFVINIIHKIFALF